MLGRRNDDNQILRKLKELDMFKMKEMGNPYLKILKELACHITDLIASGSNKHVHIVYTGKNHLFQF